MDVNGWWGTHGNDIRRTLFLLFLGQVISFVMSLMSFTSSLLATLGVDTPLTLSFFVYLALSLVYGSIFIYRRQKLQVPWYWYLLIGFADVQGNFLVNQAFQYSSITSVTILDCWTIAWVILLTWYFLGTRYSLWQFFGAAVCVAGLGLVLLSDAGVGGGGGSRPLLGDTFVIMGTLFYALSNVGEEICVKKKDRIEVITMMAISGLLVSICEIAILETKGLASVKWSPEIVRAPESAVLTNVTAVFSHLTALFFPDSGICRFCFCRLSVLHICSFSSKDERSHPVQSLASNV
nr:solute carrier family 35 member F1-like isoform X1 [Ipomoea batatas]